MNIKEAENLSGISGQNIRYYEKQGLISPKRNRINSYREYGEEDIRILKTIRMLRMLDMPIEQIRLILKGDLSMGDALDMQKVRLEVQAKKLQSAISFCEQMGKEKRTLKELDIDRCLEQMEKNTARDGYFTRWVEDYKKIAREEAQRVFTFIPDDAVTNPREFTNALLAYAKEKNLNLVITKEGMYPEFEIDGVEYRAERNYGRAYRVPVAVIHCEMIHPELYETEMEPKRRRWVKILYHSLPALGFIFLIFLMMGGTGGLSLSEFFTTKEGVILLILIVILGISEFMHFYLLYRNMDGPR
ncbi:MerR family transcriptional regulator [Blautia sp.]|uniref:HTH-type transcriptional regulator HmrR n=1 Tax=Blautia glucerasea TaxID=536633 RepID=A0A6N2ST86_9FIRM